jgi:hypothetical protein
MQWDPPWLGTDQQTLVARLLLSHQRAFQTSLIAASPPKASLRLSCQELFACGFPVLAHDGSPEPTLTYANAAALRLWVPQGTTWWDCHHVSRLQPPNRRNAPLR